MLIIVGVGYTGQENSNFELCIWVQFFIVPYDLFIQHIPFKIELAPN